MSGSLARKGFRFQDLYILRRILEEGASHFASIIEVPPSERPHQPRFGIEVGTSAVSNDDWDSVIEYERRVEVIEAKSGCISKSKRIRFWRRLRREAQLNKNITVHPVLVVDPSAEETTKWKQLAAFSSAAVE